MSEVVKYANWLNELKFADFKSTELNLLMTICAKVRDTECSSVVLDFADIRRMSAYSKNSTEEFIRSLKDMNDKLQSIVCRVETKTEYISFVLFPTFIIDKVKKNLTVRVNEDFRFVLNGITKNFTRFELAEFVEIDGKYVKHLYRLLKQFRSTGIYSVGVNELREKLDCPKSYNNKQFMQNVINIAVAALQPYFGGHLVVTPQYAAKRGKPVIGYVFTFDSEAARIKGE